LNTFAVIDFETTGLSPMQGARPTEIAVVLVSKGKILDRYQSLMNPGINIPPFIQAMTGITNQMVCNAPAVGKIMKEASKFVGNHPLVAHNASFDKKFWDAELQRIRLQRQQEFTCSLLLARRVFPDVPNHKLGTLVDKLGLPNTGRSHRALADAEAAAYLLVCLQQELMRRYKLSSVSNELLLSIQRNSRNKLETCVRSYSGVNSLK
jgi:DNA polymerase-3 subunit epsilon